MGDQGKDDAEDSIVSDLKALDVADLWDVDSIQAAERKHAAAVATLADRNLTPTSAKVEAVLKPFLEASTKKGTPEGQQPVPFPSQLLATALNPCVDDLFWEPLTTIIKRGHVASLTPCTKLLPTLLEHHKYDLVAC